MSDPLDILRQYWGYPQFRPLQREIIDDALNGRDTLALLPTGGGKSVCYQVPALCREGVTIVVSPLIALMKDQVYNLQRRGIPAAAVFSGMNRRALDIVFDNAVQGAYKLLYLSPERLQTDLARERIRRMQVNLLAIDEAHCISQWGYDFRPPYLQIAELRALIPHVPVLALTATATPEVVADIQEKLHFREKNVFQQGFARPNLAYAVLYESKKRDKLLDILRNVPGSSVVYVRTRGEAEQVAAFLKGARVSADFYHAGLPAAKRNARQDAWIQGRIRVIVSTNAFGMGIDKPDVRTVVHLHLPDSLEAYFQEAGRGGRDGQKAYAVLLYSPVDADNLRRAWETAFPPLDQIRRVYQALTSYAQIAVGAGAGESVGFDLSAFAVAFNLEQGLVYAALRLLELDGWIALSDAALQMARAHIHVSRETLYDYQLRNPQADAITKVLLRAYPGIHHDLVEINEDFVAKHAKMQVATVVQILEAAQRADILTYLPRTDKPQLTFLQPIMPADQLVLSTERYAWRKQRALERWEASVRYAETRTCRSQLLLDYFGEKNAEPCGICDVCTGRNDPEVPDALFAALEQKVRELLRKGPKALEEILGAFPQKRHEAVAKVLNFMLEERILQEKEGKFYL
ncbi:MAG: ATP-dependent DNA helicase RecQ [Saprospiraceae bacterium]|nr:ATP-dependent DNA helicase RecQ [Saprospiraceae bacterium]